MLDGAAHQGADALREVAGELEVRRTGHVRHLRTFAHAHREGGTGVEQDREPGPALGRAAHQHREVLEWEHAPHRAAVRSPGRAA